MVVEHIIQSPSGKDGRAFLSLQSSAPPEVADYSQDVLPCSYFDEIVLRLQFFPLPGKSLLKCAPTLPSRLSADRVISEAVVIMFLSSKTIRSCPCLIARVPFPKLLPSAAQVLPVPDDADLLPHQFFELGADVRQGGGASRSRVFHELPDSDSRSRSVEMFARDISPRPGLPVRRRPDLREASCWPAGWPRARRYRLFLLQQKARVSSWRPKGPSLPRP